MDSMQRHAPRAVVGVAVAPVFALSFWMGAPPAGQEARGDGPALATPATPPAAHAAEAPDAVTAPHVAVARQAAAAPQASLPERLSQTGLYAPGSTTAVDPSNVPYTPQYPLWSDGASKRRWIHLPEGTRIDASDLDHWRFPAGTRFYKEFSVDGRRAETRVLELTAAGARYATYVWNADDSDATLAPERGLRAARTLADGSVYEVPSRLDCVACHEGQRVPVLGFDALQLSPDRDPLAPNGEPPAEGSLDLAELVRRGLIDNLSWSSIETPPRVEATSAVERAARGYLAGNCAHCHNAEGPLAHLGLDLEPPLGAEARAAGAGRTSGLTGPSKFLPPGVEHARRVVPGSPDDSVLAFRMRSLASAARMPPLGTRRVDAAGLSLIERWISEGSPERSR